MEPQHYAAYYALLEVAKQENTPLSIVIQEIEDAIRDAYSKAASENNTSAISAWAQIPCKDSLPTAIELISYLLKVTSS